MSLEKRQNIRYDEIGKVFSEQLCALPAVLDDISLSGCKIHYSFPVVADLEEEYELKVSPLHTNNEPPLKLICKPQWVNEQNGNTSIGFEILYSPDLNRLSQFILILEELSKE